MPATIKFNKKDNLIKIRSFGEVTAEDMQKTIEEASKMCRDHGVDKILVDASDETSLPSVMSLFEIGSNLVKTEGLKNVKFAVIMSKKTMTELKFLESVTQNRGGLVEMVSSREEALEWLNA